MTQDSTHSDFRNAIQSLTACEAEQIRIHRIDREGHRIEDTTPQEMAYAWEQSTDEFWIDFQTRDPKSIHQFLTQLKLHPLILDDCLTPNRTSRFSSYEACLHFEVPIFSADDTDEHLSVVCIPRVLITIRTSQIAELDELILDRHQQVPLLEGTKSALLYAIFDALTGRLVQAASRTRDTLRSLSRTLDSDPKSVDLDAIIAVRRSIQDIAYIAEDQLYCIHSLVPVDSDALRIANHREYIRDAVRTYESASRVLQRYERQASELYQQYQSTLQARTESRLRTLTILSSICLPLTLISGIYGMNFSHMPELIFPYGYPIALISMGAIVGVQLWYFHRHGWFG